MGVLYIVAAEEGAVKTVSVLVLYYLFARLEATGNLPHAKPVNEADDDNGDTDHAEGRFIAEGTDQDTGDHRAAGLADIHDAGENAHSSAAAVGTGKVGDQRRSRGGDRRQTQTEQSD